MLKCKACGADIPFIPDTQNYICPYCETVHTHEELTAQEKEGEIAAEEFSMEDQSVEVAEDEKIDDAHMHVYIYTCPQCGGELLTTDETYATFCSYCGSSVILKQREGVELKPDYIIPFQISKEKAAQIYHEKLKKSIFAPSYIQQMDIEKVRGIYMPYWTYSGTVEGPVKGEYVKRTRRSGGTQVDTYFIDTNVKASGDGLEYDSSSTFPDDLSEAVAPFHFKEAKKFDASYMSGFYADRGDVEMEAYADQATEKLVKLAKSAVEQKVGIPERKQETQFEKTFDAKKAAYPVWFISARNRAENKVSYAVINGQTGKIAADIPIDPKKLLLGTLVFSLPCFVLMMLLFAPTPRATSLWTAVMSFIGMGITGFAVYRTKIRHTLSFALNGFAIAICLSMSILNPFQDEIHYFGILIAISLCVLSYMSIFIKTNKRSLRKLPQLGKRGGDENA